MKTTEKMEQASVFGRMFEGFALHEVICDAHGAPSDYRFLYVNPAFERLTGRTSVELVGKTLRELLPQPEEYWFDVYGRVATTGEPTRFERFSPLMNKHVEVSAYSPMKGQFAAIFLDITERKQMEESLRATRQLLSSLLEATPMPIYVLDASGRYSLVNRAWEEITGTTREKAMGMSPHDTVPEPVAAHCLREAEKIFKTGQPISEETLSMMADGEYYFHTVRFPVRDADGNVDAVANLTMDITSRRRAEKALKESEAVLRSFFDSPGQHRGIVQLTDDDIINISVNESAAAFVGATKESLRDKSARQLGVPDDEVKLWIKHYEESRLTGKPVRFEFHQGGPNKKGWFVARVSYLGDFNGSARYAYVITDVTERKKAEAERERLFDELQKALSEVKTLKGLLPICSSCKKIRDDAGLWSEIENYIQTRSDAYFSHGICPDCLQRLYPDIGGLS